MSLSSVEDPRNWLGFIPATLKDSPLYSELWEHIKEDAEILAFVNLVDKDQPNLVTFFATVNFLLLREPHQPFALYYPYLHQEAAPPLAEAYPFFREFVLTHSAELRNLLPTARLQTNEPTRCTNLLPAFVLAYRRGGYQPLNMVEIGSSAGLNLLWNKYCYRYGSGLTTEEIVVGDLTSPVQIRCEVLGPHLPPLPEAALPVVANCQGIELVPRDIYDEEDMRWVRAAIWPEELGRHQLLDAAIRFAQQKGVPLHKGDACDLLPAFLDAIPQQHTAVVWSSFAVNQGPLDVKEHIDAQIAEASHGRTLYRISLEFTLEKQAGPRLELSEYQDGQVVKQELLARCAVHGESMTWLEEQDTLS
jgi:hypothetical protein